MTERSPGSRTTTSRMKLLDSLERAGSSGRGGSSGGGAAQPKAPVEPRAAVVRRRTTALMNLASIVERADEQVLPAVYYFMGRDLKATPTQLGSLTLCRALVQALSSPISGILGDKYDRTHVIAAGCCLWGIMTSAIGLSASLHQAMISCAFNGFGLALVIPCIQSLVADMYPSDARGRAFGLMSLISSLGGMVGGFYATNMGSLRPYGIEGWRFAFHLTAGISLLTTFLVLRYAVDPRPSRGHLTGVVTPLALGMAGGKDKGEAGGGGGGGGGLMRDPESSGGSLKDLPLRRRPGGWMSRAAEVGADIATVLKIRTFQIIVVQGIVGMIPWNAMVFITLWLQLLGFPAMSAATLNAVFSLGCACGSCGGGILGDFVSRTYPNSGRIAVNQLCVIMSLPLSYGMLKCMPVPLEGSDIGGLLGLYAAALFCFGLLISWCGVNNSALFADVVPDALRSTVYAFDRSFEGSLAAFSAPVVGLVAEKLYGFKGIASAKEGSLEGIIDARRNADALSSSLFLCMSVPWMLCFLAFSGLHWSYPRDRRQAAGKRVPGLGSLELQVGSGSRPSKVRSRNNLSL